MVRIIRCLEGQGWMEGGSVATKINVPLANLKSAFERLHRDGLIERGEFANPTRYRIAERMNGETAMVLQRLLTSPEFEDIRT
jgi:hypothetical protein